MSKKAPYFRDMPKEEQTFAVVEGIGTFWISPTGTRHQILTMAVIANADNSLKIMRKKNMNKITFDAILGTLDHIPEGTEEILDLHGQDIFEISIKPLWENQTPTLAVNDMIRELMVMNSLKFPNTVTLPMNIMQHDKINRYTKETREMFQKIIDIQKERGYKL